MRLLWLIPLALPIACGASEPAPPNTPPSGPPPTGTPHASDSARGPADAGPAPSSAEGGGAPSSAGTAEVVPKWIVEGIGPIRPKLGLCYSAGLAKEPGMVGTVMLSVGIDKDGKMTASSGATEPVTPAVVACVIGHLTKTKFSPPAGQAPIALTLPVHFKNNPVDGPSVPVGKFDARY